MVRYMDNHANVQTGGHNNESKGLDKCNWYFTSWATIPLRWRGPAFITQRFLSNIGIVIRTCGCIIVRSQRWVMMQVVVCVTSSLPISNI
jgi:hypothetical protein